MAAFSHQYPPFLLDSSSSSSSFFIPTTTSSPSPSPSPLHHHHRFPLQYQDTSSSCTADPSPFVPHQTISPETSMVVDKLESGDQVTQNVTPTPTDIKKRKTTTNSPLSKDSTEGRNKKQKKSNGEGKAKQGTHEEEPPTGYIHVRARRGQATDSHSLAERVRREKISERMKMLQRLVPGCDKVTGKALVLDEIINYVQSLQNQVEFLSMKLASMNPLFYDFAMDLDSTLLVRPDHHDHQKLNSIASPLPSVPPQCSPNQATTFADATTTFPAANSDYLLDYSSPVFLQGQRSNVFSEHSGGQLWEGEDQRQKLLHPYGFSNNLCSLN